MLFCGFYLCTSRLTFLRSKTHHSVQQVPKRRRAQDQSESRRSAAWLKISWRGATVSLRFTHFTFKFFHVTRFRYISEISVQKELESVCLKCLAFDGLVPPSVRVCEVGSWWVTGKPQRLRRRPEKEQGGAWNID